MNNIFKQYPNLQSYFETSDKAKFFKPEAAKTHAKSLKDKEVKEVKRQAEKEISNGGMKETAKDIVTKSATMDMETANSFLQKENALEEPRKTVVEALTKRISELETNN